ncbi:uncharacterized protein LOC124790003 isoform X1 [Schistocerca piceifrons]|uniref:uncharacterized protein LOC124790003 isoform X1 n=1 Tax=Schistocerca piceifrons TaxID=274613 RepID=UPI001F5FF1E4|nr:uncharacterized protein LOC124790003 isoform X1 [Schistocerca piceifrons]
MAWIATVLLLVTVTTASASVIGIPRGTSTSLRDSGVSIPFEDYKDGPDGASAAAGLMEDAATDGLGYMSGVRLYTGAAEGDSGFGAAARRAGEEAARGGRRVVRQKPPGTVYDHIFNIPKTVLRSVNQGLNNRQAALMEGNRRTPRRNRRLNSNRTSRRRATGSRRSGAASRGGRRPVNYDDIFNIPISTLDSVNQLLNNLG